ncbi:MAG: hypothetical protein AB1796_05915 [Bacillota bacterium]
MEFDKLRRMGPILAVFLFLFNLVIIRYMENDLLKKIVEPKKVRGIIYG